MVTDNYSQTTEMRLVFALIMALVVASEALVKHKHHCDVPDDIALKQRQIIHIISSINKPTSPEYRESSGIIEEYKLKDLGHLPRHQVFSLFDQRNWNETLKVLELLLGAPTFDDFIKRSEVIHLRVNEELFYYAFAVAVLHRRDTQGVHLPPAYKVFPDKFLKEPVIQKLKEVTCKAKFLGKTPIIDADLDDKYNHLDPSHELEYFTEDVGMNSHHYQWHTINPAIWLNKFGDYKDRKGELFYWMHQQMVSRYDVERLSNYLPRIPAFENWDDEIEEGYDPHLTMAKTQYHYAFRPPGYTLHDLPNLPKSKLRDWSLALLNAIHRKRFIAANGTEIPLNEHCGIDHVGNAVEANFDTVNFKLYGNLHCYAHVIAARITDPFGAYGEDSGAMYDVATSARDPLFYRWHKYINSFFVEHKETLKPYTKDELNWSDVEVKGISVQGQSSKPNWLKTYWQYTLVKINQGFEFTQESPAYVKLKHLQHEDFDYIIDIKNKASAPRYGVVRIFLAPVYSELDKKFTLNEQRLLMLEMDKFVTKLAPGKNTIRRCASNSTVTLSSKNLYAPSMELSTSDHCKCGWPDYLLVPKGTYKGMKFKLFVAVTDYMEDKVESTGSCYCKDGLSYCGGIDAKFPDHRAMGFPFDRKIKAFDFDEFETDNMADTTIKIQFTGEMLPPQDFYHD